MIRIGSWSVAAVQAERFRLDGGAMFGVVPRPLWSRRYAADEMNRIQMVTRCLLVRGEGRTLLIDTGMGDDWADKERDIYAIENGRRSITASLASHGVAPADVTDVILTHLHFDHAGGATTRAGGRLAAAFPNALHHVQESQLQWSRRPTEKDRRSFRLEGLTHLEREGRLRLIQGAAEIAPGIHVEPTDGHTIGHQIARIGEGRGAIVYCGDLIPTAAHLPTAWVMAYDLHPLTTMNEKRALRERASRDEWIVVFEHDAAEAAVRVRREGNGFASSGRVEGLE